MANQSKSSNLSWAVSVCLLFLVSGCGVQTPDQFPVGTKVHVKDLDIHGVILHTGYKQHEVQYKDDIGQVIEKWFFDWQLETAETTYQGVPVTVE